MPETAATSVAEHRVVVMGVAGSGKTLVGSLLAERLGARFVDADDAHPPANIAKMAAGSPLTDDDRMPWLATLRDELADSAPVVVTCSALKRRYRDELRAAGHVRLVMLDVDPGTATERVGERSEHFMPSSLVASQFGDLELPTGEPDVVVISATRPIDEVVDAACAAVMSL